MSIQIFVPVSAIFVKNLMEKKNKHSESIASNTKSPTSDIFNQNSSSRTKLNFDF
jgi:hypothetical protein